MARPHNTGQVQTHVGDRQATTLWEEYCQVSRDLRESMATVAAQEYEIVKLREQLAIARAQLAEYVRDEEA